MFIKDPKRPNAIRFRDKILLLYSEIIYLTKRLVMRIVRGKEKRDQWFTNHKYSWLSPIKGKTLLIRNEQGIKFWIKVGTSHVWLVSATYEPNVLSVFKPDEGDTVIDLGANIGKYTAYAGLLVGKKGKVIALEPFKETFDLLCRNIKQNHLEDLVIPICAAASDKNGRNKMFFLENSGEANSLVYNVSDNYVQVNTITIDSLVADMKLSNVNWMKIDVEGAEYNVLQGAKETLIKNNLNLIVEVLKDNQEKVFSLLKSLGYSISVLESYDDDRFSGKGYYNVLARRS